MKQFQLRAVDPEHPHPRDIARQRVAEWKSNAEREGLPVVNRRDNKGAEPLNVDEVLRRSEPNHVRSK